MAIQQTLQLCIVLAIAAIGIKTTLVLAESVDVGSLYDSLPSDDYFVARGHSAKLECDVVTFWQQSSLLSQSSQTQTILEAKWLLNGVQLTKDDGRWKIYKNGTLVIPKFGKRLNNGNNGTGNTKLEGFYQCLAENQRVGALLAKNINLRIAYMREFVRQPEDLQVREGRPVIIPCSINSLPKATVQWERDEKPLPQIKKYVPLPSGSLFITNVHSSDVGSYRCKVVNVILKKTKKSKPGYLALSSPPFTGEDDVITTPDIIYNVTAQIGTDINLYCVVNANGIPTIRWLHENDSIVLSNSSVLTLRNITLQQRGRYTCSVLSSEDHFKRDYFVNINQAPVFNSTPASGVHTLARTIRLNCTATGTPPPQIRWFKNGRPFNVHTHIRAKVYDWGLLISSSTASDSGIYQCLATNTAGMAWSCASVRLNSSTNSPSEPRDIQCLPYKEDSVCLRWRGEPNVQAYTIIAHKTGSELSSDSKPLKDYLTNETFILLNHLYANTKYTFLIRTFSRKASTEFANVSCSTGIRGVRNFTAQLDGPNSMVLNWQPVSNDYNPCNEAKNQNYQVQWRKIQSQGVNSINIVGFEATISGLISGENYEFRVKPAFPSRTSYDSLMYSMPAVGDLQDGGGNNLDSVIFNETDTELMVLPPLQLNAVTITTRSINVSWTDRNPKDTMYNLCYVVYGEGNSCEYQGNRIESFDGKSILIDRLRPKTEYEIRVQAFYNGQTTKFSHSLLITTPSDVPSEVQGLEYTILSRTSACVKWEPPSQPNGRIIKYSIRHSSNVSWSLDKWIASSILMPRSNDGCWNYDSDELIVSTVLHDLDPELVYYVNVVAVNDAGSGSLTIPVIISTKNPLHSNFDVETDDKEHIDADDIYYRQGIGVALGFGIALVLIIACVGSYFIQKFVKRRLMAQRHFAPNGGPYSNATTRPKQNGQECLNDTHELQHLVGTNGHSHIPCMTDTLDTKGGTEYPNGVNNINHSKDGYLNGHATNLRITENPQYYKKADMKCIDEVSALNADREYEQDTNSNLQKVCPITKSLCLDHDILHNDANTTFNSTQTTILLDDSVSSSSSPCQPTLEPNG